MQVTVNSAALLRTIAVDNQKPYIANIWYTINRKLDEYGLRLDDCLVSHCLLTLDGAEWTIKAGNFEVGQLIYKADKFSVTSLSNPNGKNYLGFTIKSLIGEEEKAELFI